MATHGRPVEVLETAGVVFEVMELADARQTAAALGYPAAYVTETVVYQAVDELVAVALGADRRVDEPKLCAALGCDHVQVVHADELPAKVGVSADGLTPLSPGGCQRVVWDERLARCPVAAVPSGQPGRSLKIDMRHFGKLGATVADVTQLRSAAEPSAYDVLLERGFIDRVTDEGRARELLGEGDVAAYVGFDPTADSLHVGSLVPIMALAHVQRSGGRAIAIVGGATALIGDPSGKTEMRQMLTRKDIVRNMDGLRRQLATFIEIDDLRHLMLDNADWLSDRLYIDFLREVGSYFSVNRMLGAECFRSRLEKGLSFIEFNYMLLQAYDFVVLAERHNCLVQMGGSDQWGNICAGMELGRRMKNLDLAGVTFPLLQSASGRKFGKTEDGNVWLDPARTSPHDFFQFWRNSDDLDVQRFLGLFTLLPMAQVRDLCSGKPGASLNDAKKVLAFAATKLLHGEGEAIRALRTAESLFDGVARELENLLLGLGLLSGELASGLTAEVSGLPTVEIAASALSEKGGLLAVLADLGLCKSRSEARRLIAQGGVYLNDVQVDDAGRYLEQPDFTDGQAMVRVGKKKHGIVRLAD